MRNRWKTNTKFLNSNESWNNKWVAGIPKKRWYYFGINPSFKEKFPYSSTILVFLTDGEHLFQFLKRWFILLGIAILSVKMAIVFLIGALTSSLLRETIFKNWLT